MEPVLSILVPSLLQRNSDALLAELERQCCAVDGKAEVLVEADDGTLTSGVKRQRLLMRSNGEYVCCVDDDDWVSPNYVAALVEGCESRASVITFKLLLKRPDRRWQELWAYRLNSPDNRRHGRMTANHLCAWRRDIATKIGWCPYLGYGDDQLWYKPLVMASEQLKLTEHHLNITLYEYRFSHSVTANQKVHRVNYSAGYSLGGLRCFFHNDKIVVESGNRRTIFGAMGVINAKGEDVLVDLDQLTEFGSVNIHV